MKIKDKVVVVTGGASGIGEALCRRFAKEGARGVVVVDLDAAGAQRVAAEIDGLAIAADVAVEDEIKKVVADAQTRFGPIDLFCSNAGIFAGDGDTAAAAPNELWERMWGIHVMAHIYAARAVLPAMIERGEGYFLNTASAAGLLSTIGSAPYSVTKHAAIAFAESVAITHGNDGVRVSVLCPQAVRTGMTAGSDGGVAAVDGMIEVDIVADAVIAGLDTEQFLILPHPEVATYFRRKGQDYDRWLRGMRRLSEKYD